MESGARGRSYGALECRKEGATALDHRHEARTTAVVTLMQERMVLIVSGAAIGLAA